MLGGSTKTDSNAVEWTINDEVIRVRQWGTERSHVLMPAPSDGWLIGTGEACSVRLLDRLVSRGHARLIRHDGKWSIFDLGSKNGLRYDGARWDLFILEPGVEIGIGATTLIAESRQSIALHGFLARILGWKKDRVGAVDHALRALRMALSRRAALMLAGASDLVPIAQALHRHTLGADRPFIACDPRRQNTDESVRSAANYVSGLAGLVAATGGSLCVRSSRLPRDFPDVLTRLREPDAHAQLIVCAHDASDCEAFVTVPIEVPALEDRADEVPRIIDEYGRDAIAALGAPPGSFTSADRAWVLEYAARSLSEIEKATLRLVALRISQSLPLAAERLGMAPVSLARWLGRRKLPMHFDK